MKTTALAVLMMFAAVAFSAAPVKVITSLPDLADFVRKVGGDRVSVDNIVKSDQNPHFVDVKPSYMMKLKAAKIYFTIGMGLEIWSQQLIDGSRNSSLRVVELSAPISKLEVPIKVDASQGDVHPYGNPHYWLDPRNVKIIIGEIVDALSSVDADGAAAYKANGAAYCAELEKKIVQWETRMRPYAGRSIVTFHKSWTYFAAWLKLNVADQVEPKPGIQPSPSHTAELIKLVRQSDIRAIIVEPFYDLSAPEQIARSTKAKVLVLSTSSGGTDNPGGYIEMMDRNIRLLTEAMQ